MTSCSLCVALDTADRNRALELARLLKPAAGYLKIGMEFFYAEGARGYEAVAAEGLPIFLDLKLHDIPNTVARAMKSLMQLAPKPAIVNLHAAGGLDMMAAAKDAVAGRSKLLAVTILTSLADQDLVAVGFDSARDARVHALRLAELARKAGLDGVVCSPQDVGAIKQNLGRDFLAVVPGLRPASSTEDDQKRVATPAAAISAGADILVIGRPITEAPDPAKTARQIMADAHAG